MKLYSEVVQQMNKEYDCCENCGEFWDNVCHCRDSINYGEICNLDDVCGNYCTRGQWYQREYGDYRY